MSLNLMNYEGKAESAIKYFWQTREDAKQKQLASGKIDQGERAGVTGGKNLDKFTELIIELVAANGLGHAEIHKTSTLLVDLHRKLTHLAA